MPELLEFEARMKNFISGEFGKISSGLRGVEKNAKTAFGGATKASGSWFQSMKGFLAANIFTRLVGGIKGLATESVDLLKVQVNAETQLASALGFVNQNLLDHASSLQQVTTFGDEAIIQAQSLIAAFIKEEDQIKAVSEAALDFAAAKGIKLSAAADLITKTIASSTNALTRYGLEVTGAAGSSERAQSAVDALNSAFGGMAKSLAETDIGRLEQMENELGDIKEGLGEFIVPLMIEWNTVVLETARGWHNILIDVKELLGLTDEQVETTKAQNEQLRIARDIIEDQKEIIKEQLDFQAQGVFTVKGGLFDPEVLANAQKELAIAQATIENINKAQEEARRDPDAPAAGPTDAELEDIRKRNEQRIAEEEKVWQEVVRIAQENVDAKQAIIDQEIAADNEAARLAQENIDAINEAQKKAIEEEQERVQQAADAFTQVSSAAVDAIKAILGEVDSEVDEALAAVQALISAFAALAGGDTQGAVTGLLGTVAALANAQTGEDFVTNGKQLIMVGDNPTGRERVTVTPINSTNVNGPQNMTDNSSTKQEFHFHGVSEERISRVIKNMTREGKLSFN